MTNMDLAWIAMTIAALALATTAVLGVALTALHRRHRDTQQRLDQHERFTRDYFGALRDLHMVTITGSVTGGIPQQQRRRVRPVGGGAPAWCDGLPRSQGASPASRRLRRP